MRIRDLQFPKSFLNTIGLSSDEVAHVLNYNVSIHPNGKADSLTVNGHEITYYNPSSISKFLCKILYATLSPFAEGFSKDKLALGLFYEIRDYVYSDYDLDKPTDPPVLSSFDKLIPAFVVHEIIEPIVGKIPKCKVLFLNCHFTDCCRTYTSKSNLEKIYGKTQLSEHDFPLITLNTGIYNEASQHSHLLYKYLELGLGKDKADQVIKKIIIGSDSLLKNFIFMLRMLHGDPTYVTDFIGFLTSLIDLSPDEMKTSNDNQIVAIEADSYLMKNIKTADDGLRNSQVFRQWSQWSTLMGLIEKQLGPMRGSMWPASDLVKPHEDKLKLRLRQKAKKKNKTNLNFEEMLETAREMYNHSAIEPGKLIEVILKDQRIWKA